MTRIDISAPHGQQASNIIIIIIIIINKLHGLPTASSGVPGHDTSCVCWCHRPKTRLTLEGPGLVWPSVWPSARTFLLRQTDCLQVVEPVPRHQRGWQLAPRQRSWQPGQGAPRRRRGSLRAPHHQRDWPVLV